MSTVKFDDCMGNEAVVFQSTDPVFSVQTDGSIFAKGDVASLDETVEFKVTAHGLHTNEWETVVQLTLMGLSSSGKNENEVSCMQKYHASSFNYHLKGLFSITFPPVVW